MNTPSANTLSAAEHTCAMILAMARNIPQAYQSMHEGKWDRSKFTGVELNGKTLGIIGTGRVGLEVARRLKAFNMTMVASDPFPPRQEVLDEIGIKLLPNADEVVKVADFITIHSPLLPSTKDMISDAQFKMMKPSCRIANVAPPSTGPSRTTSSPAPPSTSGATSPSPRRSRSSWSCPTSSPPPTSVPAPKRHSSGWPSTSPTPPSST